MLILSLSIPTLTGLGIGWWMLGPEMGAWLHGLLPRLIPLSTLSVLGALVVCFITLRYYPYMRDNGGGKDFFLELLEGALFFIVLILVINQVFNGWPGQIIELMGIAVTVCAGGGSGVVLVFLASLLGEVIYPRGTR